MSVIEITPQPSGTETYHEMVLTLDQGLYRMAVYTNECDGRWYFNFAPEGGNGVNGVALAARIDLLEPYRHLDMPPGYLFVSGDQDPDLDAFREGRTKLLYLEAA